MDMSVVGQINTFLKSYEEKNATDTIHVSIGNEVGKTELTKRYFFYKTYLFSSPAI